MRTTHTTTILTCDRCRCVTSDLRRIYRLDTENGSMSYSTYCQHELLSELCLTCTAQLNHFLNPSETAPVDPRLTEASPAEPAPASPAPHPQPSAEEATQPEATSPPAQSPVPTTQLDQSPTEWLRSWLRSPETNRTVAPPDQDEEV